MGALILSQIASDFNARAAACGWPAICDSSLAFDRPDLNAVAALWTRLADSGTMPARLAMTPRVLKACLSHVSFYERQQAGNRDRYLIRLQGSAYEAVTGNLTGKFVDEALPDELAPLWQGVFEAVMAQGRPLRFLSRSAALGKSFLVGEYLSAPLLDTNGDPNCIMSVGYYSGTSWDEVVAQYSDLMQPYAVLE